MAFDFLIQLLVNGFIIGLLYGVVAMSFVLIYKFTYNISCMINTN